MKEIPSLRKRKESKDLDEDHLFEILKNVSRSDDEANQVFYRLTRKNYFNELNKEIEKVEDYFDSERVECIDKLIRNDIITRCEARKLLGLDKVLDDKNIIKDMPRTYSNDL